MNVVESQALIRSSTPPSFWEQEYQRLIAYDAALEVVEQLRQLPLDEVDAHHPQPILALFHLRNAMIRDVPGALFLFDVGIPQNTQNLKEPEYEWVVQCYLHTRTVPDVPISDWLLLCYMIGLESELKRVLCELVYLPPRKGASLLELWTDYIRSIVGKV